MNEFAIYVSNLGCRRHLPITLETILIQMHDDMYIASIVVCLVDS